MPLWGTIVPRLITALTTLEVMIWTTVDAPLGWNVVMLVTALLFLIFPQIVLLAPQSM